MEPDGVEQIMPSQAVTPRLSPASEAPSSTMRPGMELVATTSFTAACGRPPTDAAIVASSTTL